MPAKLTLRNLSLVLPIEAEVLCYDTPCFKLYLRKNLERRTKILIHTECQEKDQWESPKSQQPSQLREEE